MNDTTARTFSINSPDEAAKFEAHLQRYASSTNPSLKGIVPEQLLSVLYAHCSERENLRLFYAFLDLQLIWLFVQKGSRLPAGIWNQELLGRIDNPKGILDDFSIFRSRMDILDSFNSISLRFRACWDKYLGILILLYAPDKYERFATSSSRKRMFGKIGRQCGNVISSHILRAITTVTRNGLIQTSKLMANSFTEEQMRELRDCIEYFRCHDVDFPDPAVDLLSQRIEALDRIRTSEAHGTGMLRKWSLAPLSPATQEISHCIIT